MEGEEKGILEGNELEGKIGKFGDYAVDVDPKGYVSADVNVKIDVIAELRILAERSDNNLDNVAVDLIEKALRG